MKPDPQSSTPRIGAGMIPLAWVLGLGLLSLVFDGWLDRQRNPNRHVDTIRALDGREEVRLKRNRRGHYVATGRINGLPVEFLLDTGATDVSIPQHLAERLGLKAGPSAPVRTASGNIVVHLTTLQHVELGNISLYNIAANINPYMHGDAILLGMSFLKHVQFTQRDDVLTLRQVKKNTVPDSPDA